MSRFLPSVRKGISVCTCAVVRLVGFQSMGLSVVPSLKTDSGRWPRWSEEATGQRVTSLSLGRETVGTHSSVNVLLPRDAAQLFHSEGTYPRRMGIDSWIAHRVLRNHKCGVFLL